MFSAGTAERRILAAAEKLGYRVRLSMASTGSRYLYCERDDMEVIVRVSNHAEAHAPAKGIRQISVSPDEWTATEAIQALREGPESITPSLGPAPLTDQEREAIREYNERVRKHKLATTRNWQELRAQLSYDDCAEFLALGGNRPAACVVAERLGVGVGRVYAALTNGKRY